MLFSEINPFVRYARYITATTDSRFPLSIPCDARLFYVCEGEGVLTVDGECLNMEKGSVAVINSGVEYKIETPEDKVTYIVLNFDYTSEKRHLSSPVPPVSREAFSEGKLINHVTFDDETELNRFLYISGIEKARDGLEKTVREYSRMLLESPLITSALTVELLVRILRKSRIKTFTEDNKTGEILAFIHQNYKKRLTNEALAEKFGYHPNYLSRLVKSATGMPLHKYVLQIKLMHSIRLLEEGNLSVGEIAEECGFCDIYYFSGYFKSVMGITASDFAKTCR